VYDLGVRNSLLLPLLLLPHVCCCRVLRHDWRRRAALRKVMPPPLLTDLPTPTKTTTHDRVGGARCCCPAPQYTANKE